MGGEEDSTHLTGPPPQIIGPDDLLSNDSDPPSPSGAAQRYLEEQKLEDLSVSQLLDSGVNDEALRRAIEISRQAQAIAHHSKDVAGPEPPDPQKALNLRLQLLKGNITPPEIFCGGTEMKRERLLPSGQRTEERGEKSASFDGVVKKPARKDTPMPGDEVPGYEGPGYEGFGSEADMVHTEEELRVERELEAIMRRTAELEAAREASRYLAVVEEEDGEEEADSVVGMAIKGVKAEEMGGGVEMSGGIEMGVGVEGMGGVVNGGIGNVGAGEERKEGIGKIGNGKIDIDSVIKKDDPYAEQKRQEFTEYLASLKSGNSNSRASDGIDDDAQLLSQIYEETGYLEGGLEGDRQFLSGKSGDEIYTEGVHESEDEFAAHGKNSTRGNGARPRPGALNDVIGNLTGTTGNASTTAGNGTGGNNSTGGNNTTGGNTGGLGNIPGSSPNVSPSARSISARSADEAEYDADTRTAEDRRLEAEKAQEYLKGVLTEVKSSSNSKESPINKANKAPSLNTTNQLLSNTNKNKNMGKGANAIANLANPKSPPRKDPHYKSPALETGSYHSPIAEGQLGPGRVQTPNVFLQQQRALRVAQRIKLQMSPQEVIRKRENAKRSDQMHRVLLGGRFTDVEGDHGMPGGAGTGGAGTGAEGGGAPPKFVFSLAETMGKAEGAQVIKSPFEIGGGSSGRTPNGPGSYFYPRPFLSDEESEVDPKEKKSDEKKDVEKQTRKSVRLYMQQWTVSDEFERELKELKFRRQSLETRHPSVWARMRYLNFENPYYYRIGGVDGEGETRDEREAKNAKEVSLASGLLARGAANKLRAKVKAKNIAPEGQETFVEQKLVHIETQRMVVKQSKGARGGAKRPEPKLRKRLEEGLVPNFGDKFHVWVTKLVMSERFDGIAGSVVAVNALCMGIEYAYSEEKWGKDMVYFAVADLFFLGWVADIVIPLLSGQFTSRFDGTTEDEKEDEGDTGAIMKLLKGLRALRAIRVLRMLSLFQDLWANVQILYFALMPLLWTMVFILTVIFMFSMFAISLIGRADLTTDELADAELMESIKQFKTTIPAMLSLLQVMTLDEWVGLLGPIFDARPWTYFFFLLYISIAGFAMMNMVTATVLEASHLRMQKEQWNAQVDIQLKEISDVHLLADPNTGIVVPDSFKANYAKCKPLVALLDLMCIPHPEYIDEMFTLIDLDGSGEIDATELAYAIAVLQEHCKSPTNAALFRCVHNVYGRLKMIAHALEKSEYVQFASDMKIDIWDMREQQLRMFAEMLHNRNEMLGMARDMRSLEVNFKYTYTRMLEMENAMKSMRGDVVGVVKDLREDLRDRGIYRKGEFGSDSAPQVGRRH